MKPYQTNDKDKLSNKSNSINQEPIETPNSDEKKKKK